MDSFVLKIYKCTATLQKIFFIQEFDTYEKCIMMIEFVTDNPNFIIEPDLGEFNIGFYDDCYKKYKWWKRIC